MKKNMKRAIKTLTLLLTMVWSGMTHAQIKSLSEIKSNTPYLLRCVSGYGYCIYNPDISSENATLGEAIVDHSSGCANDLYRSPINIKEANNQWYIENDGSGNYYLKNVGNGLYISNETTSNMGWWGGSGYTYGTWFFTENAVALQIEENGDGAWAVRVKRAAENNNTTAYLCAAGHSQTAILNWKAEDAGSAWEILTIADDAKLYHKDAAIGDDKQGEQTEGEEVGQLGEVIPEGDTRYFCFRDSQLIAIPEEFIMDREEDEQFIKLTLRGDTTFTLSKYALMSEGTEAPFDLPTIESFKFNNKFNDQLYTDAEGVIDSEKDSISVKVASISKMLVASIKLPETEDTFGTKVWVDGVRNISKETRRRFDEDVVYTVARPNQFVFKVIKTKNEKWSTPPTDNEEKWLADTIALTADMLSTNWPHNSSETVIGNMVDGNADTYFHSDYSSSNNWKEGAYYGDGTTTWPYLQIELAEPIENFSFSYTTRNWNSNNGYAPQGFIIMASQDGGEWKDICTLSKDSLPIGAGVSYVSPVIEMGAAYKYIRLQLTESTRKNYLVLAEFGMNSMTLNPSFGKNLEDFVPELISPAQYEVSFRPYGRDYKVHVDFPAEMSTSEYHLPRIDILFGDSTSWSNSMWIGRYGKTYFEDASIEIDGAGIYPDMPKTHLLIRGRGNSSWSNSSGSKNPYRLKFDEKLKPFGMTKGKSWVLLANKQSNSMTTNAIAMKIADMVESEGCNHCIPVELYVNGQYRGSYNFTEKVGFSNNSIDLDDDSKAAMLELDSYYDEAYKFRDSDYNLYVNVKEPDLDDGVERPFTFDDIKAAFNSFTSAAKSGYYAASDPASSPLDVKSFVRAMLVTDLTRNTELQHPKSWYVYCEDVTDRHNPWHFGPVWDFDWSYGYEGHGQYFVYDAETDIFNYGNLGVAFFRDLLRNSSVVKKEYYRLWTKFIQTGGVEELVNYCDDLYEYAAPSFAHNATQWGDGTNYAKITENSKSWLKKRANYIYKNLEVFDLGNDIITEPEEWIETPSGQLDAEKPYEEPDAVIDLAKLNKPVSVYNLYGQFVGNLRPTDIHSGNLNPGIYVVKGKKIVVR